MPTPEVPAAGWDCHVHVFDGEAAVRPGHYRPVHRPLHEIEATAARHGIGHLVLVQPSVYGNDNTVMLRALEAEPGRHRGVAVIEPTVDDAQLDRLDAAGVRGIRFNLVSPAGHAGDAAADLRALAPRLRERGWHVQWYAPAEVLPRLAALQSETGLCFVLDHLAGLHDRLHDDAAAWPAVQALAEAGAWVKLSGWYRLGTTAPYTSLHPIVQRLAAMFGAHTVWGSDWPHTSFAPDRLPSYASTLVPLRAALQEEAVRAILHDHAPLLYVDKAVSP